MDAIPPGAIRELQAALGEKWVLSEPGDLIAYEYDGTIERGKPQVVCLPAGAEEVAAAVRIAVKYELPVVPRGAGTGLSGGAVAAVGGLLVVMSRMKRILAIDAEDQTALLEPGVVNLDVSKAVAPHGLFYAPDPSSQRACTIGGNVSENAGGPHCLAYGVTTNHVLGLEVVLASGETVWLGGNRDLPGYDLTGAVVGSEGTLCIVTKVLVRLMPLPESTRTLLGVFESVGTATEAVSAIIAAGLVPAALEMLDQAIIQAVEPALHVGYPLDAGAVLLIEVEGLEESTAEDGARARAVCEANGAREVREAVAAADRERLWAGRKGAISAIGRISPNYYLLDGVVPRTRLPEVMAGVAAVGEKFGFPIANVFHAGDGNLHPNILFDERTPGETARVLEAGEEIMRLCVDAGGSVTGEHGIGLEKRDYMPWLFTEADLAAMSRLKAVFGAGERFNPCKAFPTSKGCGEVHHSAIQRFGADAYV